MIIEQVFSADSADESARQALVGVSPSQATGCRSVWVRSSFLEHRVAWTWVMTSLLQYPLLTTNYRDLRISVYMLVTTGKREIRLPYYNVTQI